LSKAKAPRVPEKVVQQQIVRELRTVGAAVYVLGRPPRKDTARMGTGQTPGIPDLYVLLPASPSLSVFDVPVKPAHGLWVEVKAKGGRLRPQQAEFATLCGGAGVPHLVGGLDVVLAYLQEHGYIKEAAHYRRTA
jgi:hypothetical protein